MKRRIKINPKAQVAYIPDDVIRAGFHGEVDAYIDALTITLVQPGTPLERVKESLEIVLRDIELRIKSEERLKND